MLTKYEPSYRLVQDVDKGIAETRAAIALNEKAPNVEQTTDADPTYDWLSSELAKSRSELVGLRARAAETQRIVAAYRERARNLDEKDIVQQHLIRATRLAEENYFSAVRKQEEARMSDELDRNRIVNVAIAENANGAVVGTALVDALRASLDSEGRATPKTVGAVADLVSALAQGVRGAKQAAE